MLAGNKVTELDNNTIDVLLQESASSFCKGPCRKDFTFGGHMASVATTQQKQPETIQKGMGMAGFQQNLFMDIEL